MLIFVALHLACISGESNVVLELLKSGWSANAVDANAKTPLFYAAELGHVAVVQNLVEAGCNLQCRDSDLRTALHWYVHIFTL